ncbi:MAG: hypothetical protein U0746_10915 [Gemmataceae bacterium]
MRHTVRPFPSAFARAAATYLAAAGLLAWAMPFQPRWRISTWAEERLHAVSPDGRYALLEGYPPDAHVNITEDGAGQTAFVADLATGRLTVLGDDPKTFLRTQVPPALLADVARDPDLLRRLEAQAAEDALVAPDTPWRVECVASDGHYWVYIPEPPKGARGLVVREVRTGRVALTVPGALQAALGPGTAVSVLVMAERPTGGASFRFEHWDAAARRKLASWPLPDEFTMPHLTRDGRYLLNNFHDAAKVRAIATATREPVAVPNSLFPEVCRDFDDVYAHGTFANGVGRQTLHVWRPPAGACRSVTAPRGTSLYAWAPIIAADGSAVAVVRHADVPVDWPWLWQTLARYGVRLWSSWDLLVVDAATGREVARLPDASAAAFTDDGRSLVVLGGDTLRVHDWPLRRPWAMILGSAALPTGVFGLLDFAQRRRRGERRRCVTGHLSPAPSAVPWVATPVGWVPSSARPGLVLARGCRRCSTCCCCRR